MALVAMGFAENAVPLLPDLPAQQVLSAFKTLALALPSVIFTHDGWTGPIHFGDETVDAGRSMPRAMIGGVLLVLCIYLLLNAAMLHMIGIERLAGGTPTVSHFAANYTLSFSSTLVLRHTEPDTPRPFLVDGAVPQAEIGGGIAARR